ncbi:MAG: DUF1311 domain-containing protein [Micavibrio aeruginosavorus]|uniref:DUF1311 domain-containing protein n=1 Tax=Micavibrio aeruginosavorus TaxID=349221 RepID=A0A7T5R0P2_9BACT|nr:MAG: DUF1311 domain-containing protein [Micavibrio aeruginosavorus]
MPVKLAVLALLLCLFSVPPSWAAEDCKDPQTQTDMNTCSAQEYKKADEELNAVYKKALKLLEGADAAGIEKFKEVQRSWVRYRDLNCDYATSVYEGGTIAPLIHATCLTELTQERTKQIPKLFAEWE